MPKKKKINPFSWSFVVAVWGFCYRCLLILFVCLFNFLSSSHDLFILLCKDHLPIFFAPIIWISYLYFLLLCLPLEFFCFVLYRFVLVGCLLTCLIFETETLVVQSSLELPGWRELIFRSLSPKGWDDICTPPCQDAPILWVAYSISSL